MDFHGFCMDFGQTCTYQYSIFIWQIMGAFFAQTFDQYWLYYMYYIGFYMGLHGFARKLLKNT